MKFHNPAKPAQKVYELYKSNPLSYANACALRLHLIILVFLYHLENGYYMAKGEDKLNYIFRVRENKVHKQ